jgi:hypothetical protein
MVQLILILGKESSITTTMSNQLIILFVCVSSVALLGEAFSPSLGLQRYLHPSAFDVVRSDRSALWAAADGKKKRRRRKESPMDPTNTEQSAPQIAEVGDEGEEEEVDISQIMDVAKFKFEGEISPSGTGRSLRIIICEIKSGDGKKCDSQAALSLFFSAPNV